MKKSTAFIPILATVVFSGLSLEFWRMFNGHWSPPEYGILLVVFTGLMFTSLFYVSKKDEPKKKKIIKTALQALAWAVHGFVLPIVLLNNVIRIGEANVCGIVLTCNIIFFCITAVRALHKDKKQLSITVLGCLLSIIIGLIPLTQQVIIPGYYKKYSEKEPVPMNLSRYTKQEIQRIEDADFYVGNTDDATQDGTFAHPFASLEQARDAVRAMDKTGKTGITVAVMAGEYRTSGIKFAAEDSGTAECPVTYCAYGDGEVIFNGGLTLRQEDFTAITDETVLSRLSEEAKTKARCVDITAYGLTADDWGKIYAIGSYNTASKYDGDYVGGMYCELFYDDTRMTVARYPNEGWLTTNHIVETGYGRETNGATTAVANWDEVRNPVGDTYRLDKELANRVASWKTLDDVWMFGFWKYTWADASTLIEKFDADTGNLTTKFVSTYGTEETAPYYFFNVLEEMDAPGEWYLDRTTGMLYMIPLNDAENAVIDLTVTSDAILTVENANYLTFRSFTVKGTRGDAMLLTGNHNTVSRCLIKNVGGNALYMDGYENLASENEITHTGKAGITMNGGDRETLTPGNSKADNNLIHDWSEVYLTYQPAVTLSGVGNICSHNEIYNSPHEAITYSGNNHIIEYNNIHDVCLLSDDAGAIYAGRRWDFYGTVIRYNCIADICGDGHKACGIYLDDALSGQTVYGNFLINIGSIGLHLGGGRDLTVRDNVLVNCNDTSISYDDRARDGVINNGWFNHSSQKDGGMWKLLFESPWQSDIWQEAYPQYARYSDDFSDTDNPDFVPNPAYSEVTGNIVVNIKNSIGNISESASRFSTIENNPVYKESRVTDIFADPANGDYTFKADSVIYDALPDAVDIPFAEIGRY